MKVIVSPAKKMLAGVESPLPLGVPALSARAARLLEALLAMGPGELQELWRVSDRMLPSCLEALEALRAGGLPRTAADLATPAFAPNVSPAILSYAGIQYQSMAAGVMDEASLAWLQGHLRVVSGFYGCVRPFDAVLPYRLEMGAALGADGARNLYEWWGDAIAREVCGVGEVAAAGADAGRACAAAGMGVALAEGGADRAAVGDGPGAAAAAGERVVNLASVEYAKAVLPHLPAGVGCTTCVFGEELRAGKPVQRSTASKAARGSMVRWMAERGLEDPRGLVEFDLGYRYAPELSTPEGGGATLVFLRA